MFQASDTPPRKIPKFRTAFYTPIKRIIENLGPAFEQNGDVLELTGFPVRIYCLRDPGHIEQLLKDPEVGTTKFVALLPRVKSVMRSGGYILRGGAEWRERRIQVQAAFRRTRLLHYAAKVPSVVERMLDDWNLASHDGASFDILSDLQRMITQANFQMFFSEELEGDTLEHIKRQTHFIEMNFVRLTPLWLPTSSNLRFRRYAIELRRSMLKLIARRRSLGADTSSDVLSTLLTILEPTPWTDEEIVDEVFSIYFGASVMSTTLAWCLQLVGSHPKVQEQLATEAQEVLADRAPTVGDVDKLVYTSMTLQEAMRLYPPSWGYPRYCESGMNLDGYLLRPRSLVIPVVYHTHRSAAYWDEPLEFRPERFTPDEKSRRHPCTYLPFGAGARICLGAQLAPMVLTLALAMVVRRFRLSSQPRFPGDPIADFGFEIHPHDAVCMSLANR